MNNKFPPNFNPGLYSLSAVAIGEILVSDFNIYEQNSIGNWLILIGQYMLTYSAQQQLIESRIQNYSININSKKAKQGLGYIDETLPNDINDLKKAIDIIKQELDKIKK